MDWDAALNVAATFQVTAEAGASKTITIFLDGVESESRVVEF